MDRRRIIFTEKGKIDFAAWPWLNYGAGRNLRKKIDWVQSWMELPVIKGFHLKSHGNLGCLEIHPDLFTSHFALTGE